MFAGALGGLLRSFLPGLVGRSTQGGVIHSRAGDGGGIVVAAADSAAGIGFLCGIGDGQVVVGQRGGRQDAGHGDGLFALCHKGSVLHLTETGQSKVVAAAVGIRVEILVR